jgi:hypothetical protein
LLAAAQTTLASASLIADLDRYSTLKRQLRILAKTTRLPKLEKVG